MGNRFNSEDFLRLVTVIESTKFYAHPRHWSRLYQWTPESFPSRVGVGVDFIYYDTCSRRAIYEQEGLRLASKRRPHITDGHPVGCDFDGIPGGVDAAERAEKNNFVGWDDDIAHGGGQYVEDAMGEVGGSNGNDGLHAPSINQDSDAELNKTEVVRDFLTQVVFKCEDIGDMYTGIRGYVRPLLRVVGPSTGPSQ